MLNFELLLSSSPMIIDPKAPNIIKQTSNRSFKGIVHMVKYTTKKRLENSVIMAFLWQKAKLVLTLYASQLYIVTAPFYTTETRNF